MGVQEFPTPQQKRPPHFIIPNNYMNKNFHSGKHPKSENKFFFFEQFESLELKISPPNSKYKQNLSG